MRKIKRYLQTLWGWSRLLALCALLVSLSLGMGGEAAGQCAQTNSVSDANLRLGTLSLPQTFSPVAVPCAGGGGASASASAFAGARGVAPQSFVMRVVPSVSSAAASVGTAEIQSLTQSLAQLQAQLSALADAQARAAAVTAPQLAFGVPVPIAGGDVSGGCGSSCSRSSSRSGGLLAGLLRGRSVSRSRAVSVSVQRN